VRLGDTGNLLKLDLVAQVDAMVDNTYMGSADLFVPSSIPVKKDGRAMAAGGAPTSAHGRASSAWISGATPITAR